jgi:hypothetical protein
MSTLKYTNLRFIHPAAWSITLLASSPPDIIFYGWMGSIAGWLVWAKLGMMAVISHSMLFLERAVFPVADGVGLGCILSCGCP